MNLRAVRPLLARERKEQWLAVFGDAFFVIPFATLNSQHSPTVSGFPESLQASAQQGFISLRKQWI